MIVSRFFCRCILLFYLLVSLAWAGDNKWTSLGPYGTQGQGPLFHPNNPRILFVIGNFVYKSTNEGNTWIETDLQNTGEVKISPSEPVILYAMNHNHFLSSTNLGDTWQLMSKIQGFTPDFAIHSRNSRTVYLATLWLGRGHFYKSTDAGSTWIEKKVAALQILPNVVVSPTDGNSVYLLGKNGVYVSRDGAETWHLRTPLPAREGGLLIGDEARHDVLYLMQQDKVQMTTDAGQSWKALSCCVTGYVGLSTTPAQPGLILVTNNGAYQRSTDGGVTFSRISVGRNAPAYAAMSSANATHWFGSNGSVLMRSTSNGTSWMPINNGITDTEVQHLAVSPGMPDHIFVVAGDIYNPKFMSSFDGGKSWKNVPSLNKTYTTQVHPVDSNIVLAGGDGFIAVSRDRGLTWQINSNKGAVGLYPDPTDSTIWYRIRPSEENCYSFSSFGVYKSTDTGVTWEQKNNGLTRLDVGRIFINPGKPTQLFVLVSGGNYTSDNGAENWRKMNLPAGTLIRRMVFDSTNPKSMQAFATQGTSANYILTSSDGGGSWVTKTKSPYLGDFLNESPGSATLYALSLGGIYSSLDRGANWSLMDMRGSEGVDFFVPAAHNAGRFYATSTSGVLVYQRAGRGARILQLNPSPATPGTSVTIQGNGFGGVQGGSRLLLGKTELTATSWSDSQIAFTIPSDARTAQVSVVIASQVSNMPELVVLPPGGQALFPGSGPAEGKTRVALRPGSAFGGFDNFMAAPVLFGATLAARPLCFLEALFKSDSRACTCTSPPGQGTVSVSLSDGSLQLGPYTYE